MSFWQIMKYTLRALFSFDLDLRANRDDIYDDEGNVLLMGPWLFQAEIVFSITCTLFYIISSIFVAFSNIVYAILFILCGLLVSFLLSSVYVACKRAVYIKKHGHMPMHRK